MTEIPPSLGSMRTLTRVNLGGNDLDVTDPTLDRMRKHCMQNDGRFVL